MVTVVIRVENARLERQLVAMMCVRIGGDAVEAVLKWARIGWMYCKEASLSWKRRPAKRHLTQDTLPPPISERLLVNVLIMLSKQDRAWRQTLSLMLPRDIHREWVPIYK